MKRVLFWGLVMPAVLRRLVPAWFLESPLAIAARHPWITLAIAVPALAIGGLLFAASGVMPLRASTGHWAVTEWLLHFAMRRSVQMHALPLAAPALDDGMAVRGAGHYDLGCRPCHGTPRGDRPQVALAMLPPPPHLPPRISSWTPEQLFYIVKHGVKFTGMPAWPSQQRDDEVWSMVAFLQRLPTLDEASYLRMARGDPETTLDLDPSGVPAPAIVRESCARCHGMDGRGRGATGVPVLAGQRPEYLARSMRAYDEGRRHSGIMSSAVSGLTTQAIQEAVDFYASRPAGQGPAATPSGSSARGREIAAAGVPARDIPACLECHGEAPETPRNPAYPRLAGQPADYLVQQLRLLQERRRGGSEFVHLMHSFVDRLEPADIEDVSAFFAILPAGGTP